MTMESKGLINCLLQKKKAKIHGAVSITKEH